MQKKYPLSTNNPSSRADKSARYGASYPLITGKVIRGDSYGRKLGFPTANLDRKQYVRDSLKVKLGVWAGKAKLEIGKLGNYKAAIVIGPIDGKGLPKLEAHLLDYKGNLYDKKISVVLKKYLRPFKKYKSEQELVRKIKEDIQKIKKLKI